MFLSNQLTDFADISHVGVHNNLQTMCDVILSLVRFAHAQKVIAYFGGPDGQSQLKFRKKALIIACRRHVMYNFSSDINKLNAVIMIQS